MTTTEPRIAPGVVEPYIAAVRALLASLPDDERDELIDDVTAHLTELAAEDGPSLAERLGPPSRYAAEFVASAGVDVPASEAPTWRERVNVTTTRDRWHSLRPAWLVLRSFLVVATALHVLDLGSFDDEAFWALVAVALFGALAIPTSQRIGLSRGWLDRGVTAAAVIGGLAVAMTIDNSAQRMTYYDPSMEPGFVQPAEVSNIWAYDRDGNPIDVFLFDQHGDPLELDAFESYDRVTGENVRNQLRVDGAGRPLPNLYPRQQARVTWDDRTGSERTIDETAPAVSTPRVEESAPTTTTTAPPEPTSTTVTTAPAGAPSSP